MFVLAITLLLGFFLRVIGLNWDQGSHLHPDERFLTLVAEKIRIPSSLLHYFDSAASPLNPYNNGFSFYVYGDFPILITRFVAEVFHLTTYDTIFLVGRALSVLFETGTIALMYFLSLLLFSNKKAAVFAAAVYSFSVLPIQQAHFFTTDSFLVFFSTAALVFFAKHLKQKTTKSLILSGIFLGLALASKVSLIIATPIFFLLLIFLYRDNMRLLVRSSLLFAILVVASFRIFQPYAFDGLISLSPLFIADINEAHKMITGEINYPPNVQWAGTQVILYPFVQIFLWGFGPVATALSVIGMFLAKHKKNYQNLSLILLISFGLTVFVYQGLQLAKYMRYFYPIYPILAIFAGYTLSKISNKKILITTLVALLIWPLSFLSVYQTSHSRVQASVWIYSNIPSNSIVTSEEWDDSLPLNISPSLTNQNYVTLSLPMFQEDTTEKWATISAQLERTDYIILSSNRVYDAVPHRSNIYPVTNRYYQKLHDESLGFKLIKEFNSYPNLGPIVLNDSGAEESFTVYDHPKILIFKKSNQLSKDAIMKLLYTL